MNTFLTEQFAAGRISAHGKISTLASAFELKSDGKVVPFSIYIIPRSQADTPTDIIASVKLYEDNEASNCPLPVCEWTPLAIAEISANAIDLTNFDVYWGAGCYVNNQ